MLREIALPLYRETKDLLGRTLSYDIKSFFLSPETLGFLTLESVYPQQEKSKTIKQAYQTPLLFF